MSDAEPSSLLYYLDAARSPEQRARMADLESRGICIFCEEHVPVETILLHGEHWYVKANDFPYPGALAHYLIVPRLHVTAFDDLPDSAGSELWSLKRTLKSRHEPTVATATVERSGDMRYNGGSVAHLHTHFVILDREPSETVRFKVSA
jgi:diadenosine tetraphosphate (Ap4A) HIT family hydrolase